MTTAERRATPEYKAWKRQYDFDHREHQSQLKRIYAQEHRVEYNASTAATRRRRYDRIAAIKMERGCIDCGFNEHPAALHFDHVRGIKLFDLGTAPARRGLQAILDEIAKCEVRCANCHAIATAERRSEKGAA